MNTKPIPASARSDAFAARLYRYIQFNGSCWDFTGALDRDGYPKIKIGGTRFSAHRVSYHLHKGDIPDGLLVCHRCDNPRCINPLHLFLGTVRDNTVDASVKGRLATGERNGLVAYKRSVARGDIVPTHTTALPGENNHQHKLTEADVLLIRKLHAQRVETYGKLAAKYGVTKGCIAHIVTRKSWRHI